ncbi:MAG: hypothetical protein R3E39_21570 [Anaerolineae bacterium]
MKSVWPNNPAGTPAPGNKISASGLSSHAASARTSTESTANPAITSAQRPCHRWTFSRARVKLSNRLSTSRLMAKASVRAEAIATVTQKNWWKVGKPPRRQHHAQIRERQGKDQLKLDQIKK